eukprot:Seg539.6 transcript_id=Seg539.6/GoldUCD/mRNA.D3Y31 product="Glutamate receptor 2" protein_id=Seg539.6/GoldUCD/D3Y31
MAKLITNANVIENNPFSDISVMIGQSIPSKMATMVTQLFKIPLITIDDGSCRGSIVTMESAKCQDEFSLLPNKKYSNLVTSNIHRKFDWGYVAVIFPSHRVYDASTFMSHTEISLVHTTILIENHNNGSITDHSIKRLKSLTSSQVHSIVVIYDDADLPSLFNLLKSDEVDLCSVKLNIIVLDPLSNDTLNACDSHTIIGSQIQQWNNSQNDGFAVSKNITDKLSTVRDVLLFDAIVLSANVIDSLVNKSKWQEFNGENIWQISRKRLSNAANFSLAIKEVKFHGASGNIEFDANGDRMNMTVDIVNVQGNKLKKIGQAASNSAVTFYENPSVNVLQKNNDNKINGHLRIVTVIDEPFTFKNKHKNGSTYYTGFCVDILDELAKDLNFTYTMYVVKDGEYGRFHNGSWTGMIGDVLYRKADMAVASITVTSIREEVIKFTKPYMELQNSYVKRRSNVMQLDVLQFLSPFSAHVWMITVLAGIAGSIVIYYVELYSPSGWRNVVDEENGANGGIFSVANSIWFTVSSWLLQGAENTPRSLSGRIFVGILWFVILIVTSTYTANMAAYFTFSKSVTEQEDIESLLKTGVSFSLKRYTAMDQYLQNSDYRVYRLLSQKIHEQKKFVKNATEGVALVQKEKNLIFLGEGPYSEWLINRKPCDLKIVNGILPSRSYGFPVRKGSPISEKISIGISNLEESNFIADMKKHYWSTLSECNGISSKSLGITEDGRVEPLQLIGVYCVLAIGIAISVISLLVEKWWKRKGKNKEDRSGMTKNEAPSFSTSMTLPEAKSQKVFHSEFNEEKPSVFAEKNEFELEWPGAM